MLENFLMNLLFLFLEIKIMNKLKEETYDYTLPSEDEIQDYCYRQAQLRIGKLIQLNTS